NFALLQAALNYAKTAEQIWLDDHPNYWSPTTALDNQVTHPGNQLNPWMLSYPVKGNPSADYAGGANPAELAWYFMLPAMDSGFGYYNENRDDSVKPTLAFNNSLAFSKPYVQSKLGSDRTGPSAWWTQRYPYNPGSVNGSKAEGWTIQHYSNDFALYTYAYDVSGIASAKAMVRVHSTNSIDATDDTYKVYDPAAMAGKPGLSINPSNVGAWRAYDMNVRDLQPDINGVGWNAETRDTLAVVPAQEIGDLYYVYLSNYRNQLLDYYIELTDAKGNVTRTEIQQVFVGAGKYRPVSGGSGFVEDINGTVNGVYPFLIVDRDPPTTPGTPTAGTTTDRTIALSWAPSTDNVGVTGYRILRNGAQVGTSATTSFSDSALSPSTPYTYTVVAVDAAGNASQPSPPLNTTTKAIDTIPPTAPGQPAASAVTSSTLSLSWAASTDNYGVSEYQILRNGAQVGTSKNTGFADSGLSPSTDYSYTVTAKDAAGNVSPVSTARSVTTVAGNVATVYYKLGANWSTANMHYAPAGGAWTAVPGTAMAAACTGWRQLTVNLGTATSLTAAFNNGSGTWDNNGGKNYTIGTGISAVQSGAVSTTNPCVPDTTPPSIPTGVTATATDATTVKVSWTASIDNVAVTGYSILRDGAQVGTVASATTYTDTAAAPSTTYSYTVKAFDAVPNVSNASAPASVTTPPRSAACQVKFTIANANTVVGQSLRVVGNQAPIGNWAPASGASLAIQGSGANVPWTGTVTLPPNTTVQYKYVKWNGSSAAWESNQATASGNREFTTPATCSAVIDKNDGSFKF
ncbi:MAG: carbohydrate binding domain-containing protein, partial [Gammaproteobacteria bacterium]